MSKQRSKYEGKIIYKLTDHLKGKEAWRPTQKFAQLEQDDEFGQGIQLNYIFISVFSH